MTASPLSVAVQGEPGCNSALAAAQFFGDTPISLVPCADFVELFNTVSRGAAAYGMAPVENSLAGSVHGVWDLLERTDCTVRGEMYFQVRHCLIAHPAVPLQEIRRIYSHEQALAQCRAFLRKLVWIDPEDIVPTYDTAGAVKMIRARGRREEAAIASARAAQIYDMRTLAEDIQTDPRNFTRFLVLSAPGSSGLREGSIPRPACGTSLCAAGAHPGPQARKSTLILTVEDPSGWIECLVESVRAAGLQVLKLETVKWVGNPWLYRLYLELDTTPLESTWDPREVLSTVMHLAHSVRLVGTYPRQAHPQDRSAQN